MWEYISKIFYVIGEAVTLLMAMLFFALTGLTAGAAKYPGETWRSTPADEHAARAIRDLNLYRMGDRQDNHLINASMRCMMACVTDGERG